MQRDPPSDHRRAWDVIPWVVNGRADEADRRFVDAHVRDCADCRDELAFQQRLHRGMTAGAVPAPDADPALLRLWSRIDRVEGEAESTPRRREARSRAGWDWTRLLAAAVVVQAIGLVALATLLHDRDTAAAPYQTLSRAPVAPAGGSVRMVPARTLSIGELQEVLQRSDLQIVQSSGDGRILTLAPRAPRRLSTAQSLASLRAEPGVQLAEPIVGDTSPRP